MSLYLPTEQSASGLQDLTQTLSNQMNAINYLHNVLDSGCDLQIRISKSRLNYSRVVSSDLEKKDLIKSNSRMIRHLIYEISRQIQTSSWFKLIPELSHRIADEQFDFITSNLKFKDEFYDLLGLRDLITLGTWGRYKLLLPSQTWPLARENSAKILLIIHCYIDSDIKGRINLEHLLRKYKSLLKKFGIHNIYCYDSSRFTTAQDQIAQNLHKNLGHWNPYSTLNFASQIYKRFPNSIVLTHPLIASLLLDNNLFFDFACSFNIYSDKQQMQKSFSFILKHLYATHEHLEIPGGDETFPSMTDWIKDHGKPGIFLAC